MTTRKSAATQMSVALLVASLAVLLIAGCKSTDGGGGEHGHSPGAGPPPFPSVDEIVSELDLAPHQEPAVRAILDAAEEERDAVISVARQERSHEAMMAARTELEAIRLVTNTQLEAALTSEQMEWYREIEREAREKVEAQAAQMRGRGGGREGMKGPRGGY